MSEHRDGVWTSCGLSADFRFLREHQASNDFIYVQTASGDYYAHKDELLWDNEPALVKGKRTPLNPIVLHLLYGDIHEMPLNVLGDECPDMETYMKSNDEIDTRLQAAATVQAWLEGRLHRGGYLHDPKIHAALDLIPRD